MIAHNAHLSSLEEEAIFIMREVAGEFERPALLFSGGKDSSVLLRLAEKAFGQGGFPFPLLMIDTGHNFPEVITFRDQRVKDLAARLVIGSVEESISNGTVKLRHPLESRNSHQSITLLETVRKYSFDALIGGARRDEEKARAKERIFSHRNLAGEWQPELQRPELWALFNTKQNAGEHFRVFPISNWTELDVWQYIAQENIPLASLYFAHHRQVVSRRGLWVSITPVTPLLQGELPEYRMVRFRTVGDMTCTCPVESNAKTVQAIIEETKQQTRSEREATRMDDQTDSNAMENRKNKGYF